jgi:putative hydrolase of the HAD superfamily
VNPALEAGFGAVFVPNDNTWALEHDELRAGAERLLTLDRLSPLVEHF